MSAISGPASPRIDEGLVARLWDAQHPFSLPLRTVEGEEILVIYRGRRRFDRGPDFPGAIVVMPGERILSGDLEIHVRTSDWRRHGHHLDPAYARVVLQVVLWHDTTAPCLRCDGFPVPVVELAPYLLQPLETLLESDPAEIPRPSPCLPGSASSPDLAAVLDEYGIARFEEKVRRYSGDLACLPAEEVLYRGIADVLGYSQNREPFRRLVELLPLRAVLEYLESGVQEWETGRRAEGARETLLLGAAGLLPSQRGISVDDPYVEAVEMAWERDGARWVGGSMHPAEWQFFRVRPVNFPTRRLAGLSSIVARWPDGGLEQLLEEIVGSVDPRRVARCLEALLLGPRGEDYWTEHSDFGQPLSKPADLVGRGRASEAAVNLFLPFLAAWADVKGDNALGFRVRAAYKLFPKRGDNEFTRYTAGQITGLVRPVVSRSACRQQGLLHIFRNWCEVKQCGECPVASLAIPQ